MPRTITRLLLLALLWAGPAKAELSVQHLIGFGAGGRTTLCDAASSVAGSNLKLCLDAGDGASYPGTGQTWTDRSGTQDFHLGSDATATTDDPTFNGVAGGNSASEYFSGDGGDFFTAKAQPAYAQTLHKDNAIFTIAAWVFIGTTNLNYLGTNDGTTSQVGVYWRPGVNVDTLFNVTHGAGNALNVTTTTRMNASAWNFIAVSIDEATGNGFFYQNGANIGSFSSTYTTPSSSNAAFTMRIFDHGGGSPVPSGTRVGGHIIVQGQALTEAQLLAIYSATRTRFGL